MRRPAGVLAVSAAIVVFASLVITAGPAAAAATLTVTPDSGLAGGQVVQVAGAGFPAAASIGFCEGVVTVPLDFNSCAQNTESTQSAALDGTVGGSLRLNRFIYVPNLGSWVDCVASPQRCVIGAADISQLQDTVVTVPLSFDPPPPPPATRGSISVSPSSGLQPGQSVTVTGSGFRPGAAIDVLECVPGSGAPADPSSCQPPGSLQGWTADASGSFTAQLPAFGTITAPPGGPTDCFTGALGKCRIVAAEAVDFPNTDVAVPIAFSGPVPVVQPGAGLVTAPATGTTDLEVSVSLSAASSGTVTVPWTTRVVPSAPTTILGPQAPASDYTASSGVVTFAPGQTTAQVTIPVSGCTGGDVEYLLVSFHDPTGARMGGFWGFGFGVIFKGT
jgi:hypothetical protein